ncbi:MAG TPA: hypothetical protein VD926_13665, partial [Acidimicrobiales bacterium]|nr:hypothetical protein [Acidimicrobiales bacterium]
MTLIDPTGTSGGTGSGDVGTSPVPGGPNLSGGVDLAAPRPLRADVWRRFRRNRLAMVGLGFIVLLVLVAIFAPLIAQYGPTERTPGAFREPPSGDHWFGTDQIGFDVFSRVVHGARISLRVGILATLIAVTIGLLLGAVAGFL